MEKKLVGIGSVLFTLGGAVLAVSASTIVSADTKNFYDYAGVIVMCSALPFFLFAKFPDLPHSDYDLRRAKRNDLKIIFDMCDDLFEGQISSLNKMKQWFNHNPKIFWVIELVKRKAGFKQYKIVGYFSIIPLTKDASAMVSREEITGADFTIEHIAANKEQAVTFYIGGIAALGWRAKGAALNCLKTKVHDLEEELIEKGLPPVLFTRPITKDGLRLAEKYEFFPIDYKTDDPMEKIHKRSIDMR